MINQQKIKEFKARKELLMDRLRRSDEDDKGYYKRKLHCLELEEKDAWRDDLIQPSDNRFSQLYKNEWLKNEKEAERLENKAKQEKKSKDKFFKDNILEGKAKVMKALDLEEKIYG